MTAWRLEGEDGSFLEWADGGWTADNATTALVEAAVETREEVPVTPTGPYYAATGTDDEFGVYLIGQFGMQRARLVAGDPPVRDDPAAVLAPGAVG